jgi:EpsI family protein
VARAAGVQLLEFAGATLLIFAVYWALAGADAARTAAFPLLLLLAAVPAADFLVEPLMTITAAIASACLSLFGIPALRDGQFFVLSGGTFEVADVCSGLRYLLAGSMAALAYAYVTYSSTRKRALFVGIAAVVLVIANGVRAFIVMAVASATEMKVLGGEDHILFGMFLFALVFIALIWFGEGYADKEDEKIARLADPDRRPGRDVSSNVIVAALLVLVAGPMFDAAMRNRGAAHVADAPFPGLPDCTLSEDWHSGGAPEFAAADLEKYATYNCRDHSVGVFVASYGEQRQGKELITWANRVWPPDWRPNVRESTVPLRISNDRVDVQEALVRDPAGWRLIWHWYQVGPSITGSKFHVKLLETVKVLTLQPVESSVVVVSALGSEENSPEELREWIANSATRMMAWNDERVARGGPR